MNKIKHAKKGVKPQSGPRTFHLCILYKSCLYLFLSCLMFGHCFSSSVRLLLHIFTPRFERQKRVFNIFGFLRFALLCWRIVEVVVQHNREDVAVTRRARHVSRSWLTACAFCRVSQLWSWFQLVEFSLPLQHRDTKSIFKQFPVLLDALK